MQESTLTIRLSIKKEWQFKKKVRKLEESSWIYCMLCNSQYYPELMYPGLWKYCGVSLGRMAFVNKHDQSTGFKLSECDGETFPSKSQEKVKNQSQWFIYTTSCPSFWNCSTGHSSESEPEASAGDGVAFVLWWDHLCWRTWHFFKKQKARRFCLFTLYLYLKLHFFTY